MKKFLTLFTALLVLGSMMVVQADYYVAGTMNGWSENNSEYQMSQVGTSDIYSITFNNVGTDAVEFKVTDGTWDNCWGDFDNALSEIELSKSGTNASFTLSNSSDVTIYFNADSKKSWVYTAGNIAYTIAGESELMGSAWSTSIDAGNDMTRQSDGITYVLTRQNVEISVAGDKTYKVVKNHNWGTGEFPSVGNYKISFSEPGKYDVTFTYIPGTASLTAQATFIEAINVAPPTIKMHGDFMGDWETTSAFTLDAGDATASLALTINTKGTKNFGVRIGSDDNWTSNGTSFTRANPSAAVTSGSGNCTLDVDAKGEYTFTWTFATNTLSITYPAIPAQSVAFNLAASIQKGSTVNLANFVTTDGIDNPGYVFYVKEDGGSYGSAVDASYTFNTVGNFVVKVEALEDNAGEPVASDEANIAVYDAYTFTSGTTIYVDFTAVDGDAKGVNYPLAGSKGIGYDAAGAGTRKTVTFSADVEWTTNDIFIKTQKNGWAGLMFTVPGAGENCAVVASDGASYSWTTYAPPPATVMMNGNFADGSTMADTDPFVIASGNATTSLTLTLDAGDYDFTMLVDGVTTGNGYTFHRDYTGANNISGSSVMTLEADVAGDYTFTWTYATSALSITFPAEPTPEYAEIKFFAPRDETNKWEHVYAYSWKKSRVFIDGTAEITTKDGEWYVVSVRKGANLLFRDNAGMQTADIENIADDACYVSTAINYSVNPKIVTVTEQCTVDYYVAGLFVPDGDDWDAADAALKLDNNQIVFSDVPAGSYQFKITNGTWAWSIGGNDHLKSGDCASIATTQGLGNVGFTIDEVQDVTITYYPETEEICLGAVTVKPAGTLTIDPMELLVDELKTPSFQTNITDYVAADVHMSIVSGDDYVEIVEGKVKGKAAGEATVQLIIDETTDFGGASETFTVTVAAVPTVKLQGSWSDPWSAGELTLSGDETSVSVTKNLAAGSYDFKMIVGGEYRSNKHLYHREWTNAAGITMNETENMHLTADISGDYTFTWTFATNEITIGFPALVWENVRTGLTGGNYYTICHSRKIVYAEGASFWSFASREGDAAYLVKEDAPYAAGKPYIIYAESNGNLTAVLDGDATDQASSNGVLYGTLAVMDQDALTAAATTLDSPIYLLSNNKLFRVTGDGTSGNGLGANRAYIAFELLPNGKPNAAPERVRRVQVQDNAATGIDELNASEAPMKVMINGQLFIIRGEKMYDATGRLVK